MHIADEILREVEEEKIVDIFAEPDKTKVFLQLKELELIEVSEEGVKITSEGRKALELGIKDYFVHKRTLKANEKFPGPEFIQKNQPTGKSPITYAIPAAILFLFLLLLLFGVR